MCTYSAQTARTTQATQLVMPSPQDFLVKGLLQGVDIAGQVGRGIDGAIHAASEAVTTAVPAGARMVTSLLPLSDTVDKAIIGALDFITQGGMWLAKITATASAQAMLCGAPAWAQATRTGVAVWGTVAELQHGDSSAQFFARCSTGNPFAAHAPLSRAPDVPPVMTLGDEHVTQVADSTAKLILDRIKKFYKRRLGCSAGEVSGLWEQKEDKSEQGDQLDKVRTSLSKRLHAIFTEELSPHETSIRINKAAASLNSEFGTYRHALVGALGGLLAVAWHTGALHSHAAMAWGYITGGVGFALKAGIREARKVVTTVLSWGKQRIQSSFNDLKEEIQESIDEQVKSTLSMKGLTEAAEKITTAHMTTLAKPVENSAQPAAKPTRAKVAKVPTHPGLISEQVFVGVELPGKE